MIRTRPVTSSSPVVSSTTNNAANERIVIEPKRSKAAKEYIYNRIEDREKNQILIFVDNESRRSDALMRILEDDTFAKTKIVVENVDRFKPHDSHALEDELIKLTKQPSFPYVWANGTYLGGNHQTKRALKNGDLEFYLGI
mmetsp:Transcript_45268/g.110254  ORF Transcript_45268/g.110254 Transcript_45268/m.110254 type:complete len:141 (-) Transcript_45268:133-555(-)